MSGLVNASTDSASAQYGYGPFGELLEATGTSIANANPNAVKELI